MDQLYRPTALDGTFQQQPFNNILNLIPHAENGWLINLSHFHVNLVCLFEVLDQLRFVLPSCCRAVKKIIFMFLQSSSSARFAIRAVTRHPSLGASGRIDFDFFILSFFFCAFARIHCTIFVR